jgi:hypothetical protein
VHRKNAALFFFFFFFFFCGFFGGAEVSPVECELSSCELVMPVVWRGSWVVSWPQPARGKEKRILPPSSCSWVWLTDKKKGR